MKLLSLLASLALVALAACATVPNPISQTTAYTLSNAYGIAQSAAVAYTALPFCAKGTHASATVYCKEQPIVIQLANADAKVRVAQKSLEAFVRNPANYPGLSYGQLFAALQSAVTFFSQLEATNGVR